MATFLVVSVAEVKCAFPVGDVLETMRPLPIEPLLNSPRALLGLSVVRGAVVPVLDLGSLIGAETATPQRFVLLRSGNRSFAVTVGAVLGIAELADESVFPVSEIAASDAWRELTVRADGILRVLSTARLLTDDEWGQIADRLHAHR